MRENSILKDRILYYLEKKGISKYECYSKTGITNGVFSQKNGLSEDNLLRFLSYYRDINPNWMINGEEPMLKEDMRALPSLHEPGIAYETSSGRGTPLIPISAFAGYGQESFSDLTVERYYFIPEFENADFIVRVMGNSMLPRYSSGDFVACSVINETLFFPGNSIYAIYTKSQGMFIKRVKNSAKPDCILLVSDNPDYDSFDVPKSDIIRVAKVLGGVIFE